MYALNMLFSKIYRKSICKETDFYSIFAISFLRRRIIFFSKREM